MTPDYKSYSLEELHDVKVHIEKDKYPERYQELLNEIALREAAVPIPEIQEVIKPKRKRTNKEKILTSAFILMTVIAFIYYGQIPGKHGGLSMDNDPIFFWITVLFCIGLAVHQLLNLDVKQGSNDT